METVVVDAKEWLEEGKIAFLGCRFAFLQTLKQMYAFP